jgi:uncharacterized membrane protein
VGINNTGQIVGEYGVDNGLPVGFVLSGGTYTPVLPPSGRTGAVGGINDGGAMVGTFYTQLLGTPAGFLLTGGQYSMINPPATASPFGSQAYGINGAGQIVGWYSDGIGLHGFLSSGGNYGQIDDPNAVNGTFAYGINSAGLIVGSYYDSNFVSHGFVLNNGVFSTIDDPNAGNFFQGGTVLYGINNVGQMSGYYVDAGGVDHGFVLSDGMFTTLDDPNAGPHGTIAWGINDAGQVVGEYAASRTTHGFLATATAINQVPEPSTAWIASVCGLAMLACAWRRRLQHARPVDHETAAY